MYASNTILRLKRQRKPDDETGEEFAYNLVRVIGPSPVSDPTRYTDAAGRPLYIGPDAAGVLLTGLSNFGGVLDEPYGRLKLLYEVESIPEKIIEARPTVRVIESNAQDAGPSPEEVFADKAPGVPPEEGQTRARTPIRSPLDEVAPPRSAPDNLGRTDPLAAPEED